MYAQQSLCLIRPILGFHEEFAQKNVTLLARQVRPGLNIPTAARVIPDQRHRFGVNGDYRSLGEFANLFT